MSSAARITRAKPALSLFAPRRLLTVADLAALPDELPSGPVRWELDDGVVVVMSPHDSWHAATEANFVASIKTHVDEHDLGKARSGEAAIVLRRNPDRVVGADVAFIAKASLPLQISKEGYLETIPDLVVEVRSK
jgi:Uma2 family endonuclease